MTLPIATAVLGTLSLVAALLLLRTLGPRFRLGRILSAAPEVSLAECRELAKGRAVYVRVNGRITSDEEFPDDNDRPLVFRRTHLEVAAAGNKGWRTVLDEREAVPFGVESRSEYVAVDQDALGAGLVAIPRIATGKVAELHGDMADAAKGADPDTDVRLTFEQLSAVEQATVCGTPVLRGGTPTLTAGLGRPLIVTILDGPAAMRLLASGARSRVTAATLLIVAGIGLLALAAGMTLLTMFVAAAPVLAAGGPPPAFPSPPPTPVIIDPLDPRAGAGAPLVGAPLLAILVVLAVGIGAALAALLYVRLTAKR